jgi:hypothetical protein
MREDDGCWLMLLARNSQRAPGVVMSSWSNGIKASAMLRSTALRFTAGGRLLGFDTGDWSMLLGGFFLAGFLALMV